MRSERVGTSITSLVIVAGMVASHAVSQHVVVPPPAASREATSFTGFPFTAQLGRHQVLIDAAQLAPLGSPWQVSEVWFRRDMTHVTSGQPSTMRGGAVDVEVSAGASPSSADGPSERFQSNRGATHGVVFRGTMNLPDVGPAPTIPAPWAAPHAVRIPFSIPITGESHQALLLEFVMTRTPGMPRPRFWIVDEEWASARGTAVTLGQSCSSAFPHMDAIVDDESLRPGSSVFGNVRSAAPGTACLHFIGCSDRYFAGAPILPLDLGPYGAPGCTLYTDALIASGHVTYSRPPLTTGGAYMSLHVPADPSLVGATLLSQWILSEPNANRLGVTMTNGVKVHLSSGTPTNGVAVIRNWDMSAATGFVQTHLAPVLRLVR